MLKFLAFLFLIAVALVCWPLTLVTLVLAPAGCVVWWLFKVVSGVLGALIGLVLTLVAGVFFVGLFLALGVFALIF